MCRIVLRLLLCLQTLISGQLACAGDTWLRKLRNQRTQASWCSRKWDRNKTAEGRVTPDERCKTPRPQLDREPSPEPPEVLDAARLAEEARVELTGGRFFVGPDTKETLQRLVAALNK